MSKLRAVVDLWPRRTTTNQVEEPLSHGRSCNEHLQTSTRRLIFQFPRWAVRQVWAAELVRECRIFLQNSRTLLSLKTVPLIALGQELGRHRESGDLIECSHTRGRSKDTREFRAAHPGAPLSQTSLFLEGWNKGAEWAARNPDFCREHIGHSSDTSRRWKGYFQLRCRLSRLAMLISVSRRHLLQELRSGHEASPCQEPSVLFVRPLRASRSPNR